jgi:hypothetical protein
MTGADLQHRTSILPPDRACITILRRARAETFTLYAMVTVFQAASKRFVGRK